MLAAAVAEVDAVVASADSALDGVTKTLLLLAVAGAHGLQPQVFLTILDWGYILM